jgi:4-amino-4-deoxy-L-arabinose transferase-like glycosyltransferase
VARRKDRPWPIGLLLGGAMLTKTTAYIVVGVAVVAVGLRWRQECRPWRWAVRQLAWMLIPALLISTPWFIRNGATYGWQDPLALARHEAVVEGQPRSLEWLTGLGWGGLLSRLVGTTFQSFWGQFGWMGVVLPVHFYRALGLLSALLLTCFLWWLFDRHRPRLVPVQRSSLILLLASFSFTLLVFLWYNLTFVQHQGRYLFPALIPIGTAAALGLSVLTRACPRRTGAWITVALFAGMALFDVYCLFRFIVPFLAR